jgi:hypothetical protein
LGPDWLVSKLAKPKFGQAKIWAYHTKMWDKNFRMCLELGANQVNAKIYWTYPNFGLADLGANQSGSC